MAIVKVNFFSEALLRYVNFMAVIPIDKRSVDGEHRRDKQKPMKALYLMHGIYGCEYDWITRSRVARWAQERNLAVIMPAGENKFYCDVEASNDNFGKFIGEDLVDFTRTMFRLSEKREDTYVGGLSMGGLGAIYAGLRYPDTFSKVGAFSSGLVLDTYPDVAGEIGLKSRKSFYEAVLGPEKNFKGSKNDYYTLAEKLSESQSDKPEFFMSCGLQDQLLESNRKYRIYLESLGYCVEYSEENGDHEWDFWDRQLLKFFNWLPLEKGKSGAEKK